MPEDGGLELLKLVGKRLDFLTLLQEEQLDKRDIQDELAHSRSTVDRAVRTLESTGLVRRGEDGYETTLTGRLLCDTFQEHVAQVEDIFGAGPVLDVLSASASVEARALRGAEVSPYASDSIGIPQALEDALTTADEVRALIPTLSSPWALERWGRRAIGSGMSTEIVVGESLYGQLKRRYGETLRALASTGNGIFVGELPQFGLMLMDTDDGPVVAILAYGSDGSPAGTVLNSSPDAVEWAESIYDRVRATARDVTAEVQNLTTAADGAGVSTSEGRWMLANAGFVTVDADYFDGREPADLLTGWRTGLDLVEVDAGYAVDRLADSGERLTDRLLADLEAGTDLALVGPPGAGKSTVSRSVACTWARERGPVYYRESGSEPLAAGTVLAEAIRDEPDPVLVVVEDAVRPEAAAAFEVMVEYRGRDDVVFLVDARESEWSDPPATLPAAVDAYRMREVERVEMPPLREPEVERFIHRFESATDQPVETSAEELLSAVQTAQAGGAASPGELLLLLHRLTLLSPAAPGDDRPTTSLLADVQQTYEALADDDFALDVGVLVNVLNAAGVRVAPEYVHAISDDEEAVRDALDTLEGRVLFPPRSETDGAYRCVHDAWSTLFLETLLDRAGERAAHVRFARGLSAVLALADDTDRLRRLERTFGGETETLEHIATAPREWIEGVLERVFAVGIEHPSLAPLFGASDYSELALPAVSPATLPVTVSLWRGKAALNAGNLDTAQAEFERVLEAASEGNIDDADRLRGRALMELGQVAFRRGDVDVSESYAQRALSVFQELDDRRRVADNRKRLGNVAWMRGDLEVAEDLYRESLATYREIDDRLGEAYALHNLGNVVDARGDAEAAEELYRDSLEIYREVGTESDEADCLNNLGVIAENQGDLPAAADYYGQSLERYRAIGATLGVANALHNLGIIADKRGFPDEAESYAREALSKLREGGDTQGKAAALRLLASIVRKQGNLESAREYARQALELSREIGDKRVESEGLVELARIDRDGGELGGSRAKAAQALSLAREVGTPRMETTCLLVLASIEREAGDVEAAGEHLAEARAINTSTDDLREARIDVERGRLEGDSGEYDSAHDRFVAAGERFRDGGAARDAIAAYEQAADAAEATGESGKLESALSTAVEIAAEAGLDDRQDALEARLADVGTDE